MATPLVELALTPTDLERIGFAMREIARELWADGETHTSGEYWAIAAEADPAATNAEPAPWSE